MGRAVGAFIYLEQSVRSHYFQTQITAQFDVIIHMDGTHAVELIDRPQELEATEILETFPSGL